MALGLGLAACQKGMSVGFTTAAALVHELMEARDDRRLLNLQRQLARLRLLIIDELGFVPLSTTGAELLFEVFSQRYERGSVLVTTNLPFDEWTDVFGSERLTGALLDRLTHHVHILEMNGDSYRLKHSRQNADKSIYRYLSRELVFESVRLLPLLGEPTPAMVNSFSRNLGWELRDSPEPVINLWTSFTVRREGGFHTYAVGGVMLMGVSSSGDGETLMEYVTLGTWRGPVVVERLR